MRGFLNAILGLGAIMMIAVLLAECEGPPSGPSCLERIERHKQTGPRYPGELDDILKDCQPERKVGGRY